ncbi:hypothetical protein BST61_g2260 [Cercospora zeina]
MGCSSSGGEGDVSRCPAIILEQPISALRPTGMQHRPIPLLLGARGTASPKPQHAATTRIEHELVAAHTAAHMLAPTPAQVTPTSLPVPHVIGKVDTKIEAVLLELIFSAPI